MTNPAAADPRLSHAASARRRVAFWLSVAAGLGFAVLAVSVEPRWMLVGFGLSAVAQLVRAVTLRRSVPHR